MLAAPPVSVTLPPGVYGPGAVAPTGLAAAEPAAPPDALAAVLVAALGFALADAAALGLALTLAGAADDGALAPPPQAASVPPSTVINAA